jgi:hypothetical protein
VLDAKIDIEMYSLHVKKIIIENLVDYVDIIRVDYFFLLQFSISTVQNVPRLALLSISGRV